MDMMMGGWSLRAWFGLSLLFLTLVFFTLWQMQGSMHSESRITYRLATLLFGTASLSMAFLSEPE